MPVVADQRDQKFVDDIDKFGWVVRYVFPDSDEEPSSFHYSCGIFKRTQKPELIVFGLTESLGQFVINEYGKRVAAGDTFISGERYEGFVGNWPVIFADNLNLKQARDHLTWTDWYYDRTPFPILQCVLPDPSNGKFPWEEGYRDVVHQAQPLLFPLERFKENS